MSAIPWRVAAQSYTVLNPNTKEPMLTLQFISDMQQADVARLRITRAGEDALSEPATEVEFATGGYPSGPAVLQPRYLKAFERPTTISAEQRVALAKRREAWLENAGVDNDVGAVDGSYAYREPSDADLETWEEIHGEPKDAEGNVIKRKPNVGPDGVADGEARPGPDEKVVQAAEDGRAAPQQQKDPYVPDGAQVKQAGLDVTEPGDEDRKGMVGTGPGSEAPKVQGGAGQAYNPSPGISPGPSTAGGEPMTGGPAQGAPGGAYATELPQSGASERPVDKGEAKAKK